MGGFVGIVVGHAGGVVADDHQHGTAIAWLVEHQRVMAIDHLSCSADGMSLVVIGDGRGIVERAQHGRARDGRLDLRLAGRARP